MKQLLKKIINQKTINKWHAYEATLASAWYGNPAKKLKIIGVTGTNGKTSVCHYITQILEAADCKVGMITTVATSINGRRELNTSKMTTLPVGRLQSYLSKMAKAGCEYAVVEVTSHALDQERVRGIEFEAVAFTNLTHDHLDYHGTMQQYQAVKERLFANHPKLAVVNADDPAAAAFLKYPAETKLTFGILDSLRPEVALPNPDISARLLKLLPQKSTFKLATPSGEADASISLPGRFTIANVLAAVGLAHGLGISQEIILKTLPELRAVEGRLEPVQVGQDYSIIVDFAHTPDALEQVYQTVRPMVRGKLIVVLGATGRRDKTKRPILGELAARYADLIFITNEDPYDEDPQSIIDQVAAGIASGRPHDSEVAKGEGTWWWRVADRKDAIKQALKHAEPDDMVVVTGKGGEHVMAIGNKLVPYNDVEVIKSLLNQLPGK